MCTLVKHPPVRANRIRALLAPRLTWPFRRETMKQGTIKAINQHMEYFGIEEKLLVELIAVEGPRWVSYKRILEYCTSGVYQILRQKG